MLPLDGIRVIDQTQVMAGPSCSMWLGDMGADVIKVEPPEGETSRRQGYALKPDVSAAFVAINRNKRGMTLDLKHAEGVAILEKLVVTADVLVAPYQAIRASDGSFTVGANTDTLSTRVSARRSGGPSSRGTHALPIAQGGLRIARR